MKTTQTETLLTKLAPAGEGTSAVTLVYSCRCAEDDCKFQTLWHRDASKATGALERHMAAKHA